MFYDKPYNFCRFQSYESWSSHVEPREKLLNDVTCFLIMFILISFFFCALVLASKHNKHYKILTEKLMVSIAQLEDAGYSKDAGSSPARGKSIFSNAVFSFQNGNNGQWHCEYKISRNMHL